MSTTDQSAVVSGSRVSRIVAALLCLAVTTIHVIDQGGLAMKTPTYIGVGYYLLEVAGVVAALLLLASRTRWGWVLAIFVALGPMLGYILSRGPGLPNYADDRGNWAEPLGVVSLIVEGALLLLALAAVAVPAARPATIRESVSASARR